MTSVTLYQKTPKGIEEIASKKHGLLMRERSVLIMVDGKRGAADIARFGGAVEEVQALFEQLAAGGFIEGQVVAAPAPAPKPAQAPAAPAASSVPTQASASGRPVDLREVKRAASRALTDAMGPSADMMTLRIEEARDANALNEAIAKALDQLRMARGRGAADRLLAELQQKFGVDLAGGAAASA